MCRPVYSMFEKMGKGGEKMITLKVYRNLNGEKRIGGMIK